MNAERIRQAIVAVPFRPFSLKIADGRAVQIHARDFILVSPLGNYVDVFQPDDRSDILDIELITGISYDAPVKLTPST